MIRGWIVMMLLAATSAAPAQRRSTWTLDSVLSQIDSEARNFHGLSADVERTKVTVVVNDRSTESGTITVEGEKMRLELKAPDPRTILRSGDNLYVYNPGLKRVEEYNLGKHRNLVDQLLLLGFGTSGHQLQKSYLLTLLDETTLDNKKVIQLELTPKSKEVRDQISKIQIWLDESNWLPVQQQFFETGSQDYFVIRYSNMIRNPHLSQGEFKPRWPKDTQKIKPQG